MLSHSLHIAVLDSLFSSLSPSPPFPSPALVDSQAWKWYSEHVGRGKCTVVDTYWQTETGSHLAANLPGAMSSKPGSCALPYFGIEFAVLDPTSGQELEGNNVEGVLCIKRPWPSAARTVYGDHDRYLSVYTRPYKGACTEIPPITTQQHLSSPINTRHHTSALCAAPLRVTAPMLKFIIIMTPCHLRRW